MKTVIILSLSLILSASSMCLGAKAKSLTARVIVAPDSCGYDPWDYTLSRDPSLFPHLNTVYQGQKFRLLVFVKNKQSKGSIHLNYKMKITGPNGRIYDEVNNSWQGRANGRAMLIDSLIYEIAFKQSHSLGNYSIELEIKDTQNNETIFTRQTINLSEFIIQGTFDSEAAYANWLNYYYLNGDVAYASSAYLHLAAIPFDWETFDESARMYIQIAFFDTVYSQNQWVLPYLLATYQKARPETRKKIIFLFSRLNYHPEQLFSRMDSEIKKFSQWAKDLKIKDASTEVITALQLDIEWARFFASGRYRHIEQIVDLLSLDELTQSNPLLNSEKKAQQAPLIDAARWSLQSNCQQHPLVNAYCQYIARHGKLKPTAQKRLLGILKSND